MFVANGAFIAMDFPSNNYYNHYHHDPTTINTHNLLKPQIYQHSNLTNNNAFFYTKSTTHNSKHNPFTQHQPSSNSSHENLSHKLTSDWKIVTTSITSPQNLSSYVHSSTNLRLSTDLPPNNIQLC